ncbi:hypothetical protein FIBSPDRAFT_856000 [Athelia psychrophila]|uniref:Uncharacterized protein n=1 Tax=Athelia psychrophila TaxID=1759441 RepID=A0A166NWF9_9AGAM|nr:hypothetical protein FIBSPDRAFT_856000 [Fibularhizoctonia sp. CBS 109695]
MSRFQKEVLQAPGSYFPAQSHSEMSGATSRPHSKHAPHPPTSPLSEHFALNNHRANERKSRPGHHRRAKSTSDLLPLRPSAKQATRSQLIIYAPSDTQVVIYPVFPVKQPSVRERFVFIDKGNAATGISDTAPTISTRSRRFPPPVLLFQKQGKSLRRASTSPVNSWGYTPSANDVSFPTPRKTVRFADDEPRVLRDFHNRVQADGI